MAAGRGHDGLGGHCEAVRDRLELERDFGEAAGQQAFGIGADPANAEAAGSDVGGGFDHRDLAFEDVCVAGDGEGELLAGLDLAGVALRQREIDLDAGQVLEVHQHRFRLEQGAFADLADPGLAGEGCADPGFLQLDLLGGFLGLEDFELGEGEIVFLAADRAFRKQGFGAVLIGFGELQLGVDLGELRGEVGVIEEEENLALFDGSAFLHLDLHQALGEFRDDVDRLVGAQGADRVDRVRHRGGLHREDLRGDGSTRTLGPQRGRGEQQGAGDEGRERLRHGRKGFWEALIRRCFPKSSGESPPSSRAEPPGKPHLSKA